MHLRTRWGTGRRWVGRLTGLASICGLVALLAACQPTLTSFAGTSGPAGTSVVITGTGFTNATGVAFNGVPATFTVTNDRSITARVPIGGSTGPISVTATNLTGTTEAIYTVTGGGPFLSGATQVVAGGQHSCALLPGGVVRCWGNPGDGELGDGGSGSGYVPVTVAGIGAASQITAGDDHTCAVVSGDVWCWGADASGRLGDGTTGGPSFMSAVPLHVVGVTNAVQVSAGIAHTCAVVAGGSIKCWGHDDGGQLGDGTRGDPETGNRLTAVTVVGITNAVQVAAGGEFTCARLADGTVRCWGWANDGRLGFISPDGPSGFSLLPVAVPGVAGATDLSTGGAHACAVEAGGHVICWGYNAEGELGSGTSTTPGTPGAVVGISTAVAVAAGGNQTCATLADGSVRCWGSNSTHELGDWKAADPSTTPVTVLGVAGATKIGAGRAHQCAVVTGGQVMCWGYNPSGALGDGGPFDHRYPVRVLA